MNRQKEEYIKIDVGEFIFDTAKCHSMSFWYEPDKERLSNVWVMSNFIYTKHSTHKWCDEVSYGLCHLDLDGFEVWKELAECIKDLDWKWKRVEGDGEYKPLDSAIKTKILQRMINFREELDQSILHTLQNAPGSLEIHPDSEGWIRVAELWEAIRREHFIFVDRKMVDELLETDNGQHYMVNEDKTRMKVRCQ